MKQLTRILLTLVSATILALPQVSAQKKAAPAKKAPAKAEAAAPAAAPAAVPKAVEPVKPAEVPPPSPASSDSSLKFSALVWGGYNIPSSAEFSKVTSGLSKGGIAAGAEFLLGTGLIRGGVAASYLPISVYESGSSKQIKTLLPIEGVLNIYLFGFYAGVRGGYVLDIGSESGSSTPYQKTNGTAFGGQLGYNYSFGPVALDVGVIATFAHTEAHGTGGGKGAHVDYTNIIPRFGIQYTF